jgi:hypothetical protein
MMDKESITLIPHIAALKDYLTFRDGMGSDSVRSVAMALEQLPYCLASSYVAVCNVMKIAREIATSHDAELTTPEIFLWLSQKESHLLSIEIDSFLESAVRTQNSLIPYLRRALRCSMPDSLSSTMKNLKQGKLKISSELAHELLRYWETFGEKLRAYRDLSQHYALVSSECALFRDTSGMLAISMTLPNNPEIKNVSKLKFTDPIIQAFPYVLNSLIKLTAISYRVTDLLLPTGTNRAATPDTFVPRDPSLSIALTGHNIPPEGLVEKEISNCLQRQEDWHSKRSNASDTDT